MGTSRDADTMAAYPAGSLAADAVRNPYLPPTLARLGDLRGATLAGSPGANDSGDPVLLFGPLPFNEEYRGIP